MEAATETQYQGWTLLGVLARCPICHHGIPIEEYLTELLKVIKAHRCNKGNT